MGSVISTDGGETDIFQSRAIKARGAFAQFNKVWNSSAISSIIKLRLFNSNVKSVLLYSWEAWLMTNLLMTDKLQVFSNKYLRRIQRIWEPRINSKADLWDQSKQLFIQSEIKLRKLKWIGHTLRKNPTEVWKQTLEWNPQDRSRFTWEQALEK